MRSWLPARPGCAYPTSRLADDRRVG